MYMRILFFVGFTVSGVDILSLTHHSYFLAFNYSVSRTQTNEIKIMPTYTRTRDNLRQRLFLKPVISVYVPEKEISPYE